MHTGIEALHQRLAGLMTTKPMAEVAVDEYAKPGINRPFRSAFRGALIGLERERRIQSNGRHGEAEHWRFSRGGQVFDTASAFHHAFVARMFT